MMKTGGWDAILDIRLFNYILKMELSEQASF